MHAIGSIRPYQTLFLARACNGLVTPDYIQELHKSLTLTREGSDLVTPVGHVNIALLMKLKALYMPLQFYIFVQVV